VITSSEEEARKEMKGKVRTVQVQLDDYDLITFITGG
jgi:hypothetical protein